MCDLRHVALHAVVEVRDGECALAPSPCQHLCLFSYQLGNIILTEWVRQCKHLPLHETGVEATRCVTNNMRPCMPSDGG